MPKWYQSWDDTSADSFGTPPEVLIKIKHDAPHMLVSTAIGVAVRNPYVSVATLVVHGLYHFTEPFRTPEEVVGPPAQPQPPPKRPVAKDVSPASHPGSEGRTLRTNGGKGRTPCPKGHYYSYKEKKCVKSKFR